jgi:hypothetical protein
VKRTNRKPQPRHKPRQPQQNECGSKKLKTVPSFSRTFALYFAKAEDGLRVFLLRRGSDSMDRVCDVCGHRWRPRVRQIAPPRSAVRPCGIRAALMAGRGRRGSKRVGAAGRRRSQLLCHREARKARRNSMTSVEQDRRSKAIQCHAGVTEEWYQPCAIQEIPRF